MNDTTEIKTMVNCAIEELHEKDDHGTLTNTDFTKAWCTIALLPLFRMEYIIRESLHTKKGYNRNEAVVYGIFLHLYRILCFQRRIVCERLATKELAGMFERMLIEDSIRLLYYVQNYEGLALNAFRLKSLKADAFFEDELRKDIEQEHGEATDWQKQLLYSIGKCYELSATTYEEVKTARISTPTIEQMFIQTGNKRLYDIVYRGKSHSIHGDWVEYIQNYLVYDKETDTFSPNFQEYEADIRQLNPVLLICYEAITQFISSFQGNGLPPSLLDELANDKEIISALDRMHHDFLHR